MKSIKEKLEIEYLKSLTYTEINEKMNMLNDQINQLKDQLQLLQSRVVGECVIHSTDWHGKCFVCDKQVFTRKDD